MLSFDYRKLDEYERAWRRNNGIPDGEPSTLVKTKRVEAQPKPTVKRERATATS
jgi:hypothetical protein